MKSNAKKLLAVGIVLLCLMLASLLFMSFALNNSQEFDQLYAILLGFNVFAIIFLLILIGINIKRLYKQLKNKIMGSRITLRMVILFSLLSVTPVLIVYFFSLDFLHRGIDSWFDLGVEEALDDSLELSRLALDSRMREALTQSEQLAQELSRFTSTTALTFEIDEARIKLNADEMTLMTRQGVVIASSSKDTSSLLPSRPSEAILLQVQQGTSYIGLDLLEDNELSIRVVVNIPSFNINNDEKLLQVLIHVDSKINTLTNNVQFALTEYSKLSYLREQLKLSFIVILTLVLLFSIFSAVWAAFYSARSLAAPVKDLAEGTKAIAAGDYDKRLPIQSRDELGFLVASFNDMTDRIAKARDNVKRSQAEAEAQQNHLEKILAQLSSGVLVVDHQFKLEKFNFAAKEILNIELDIFLSSEVESISNDYEFLEPFIHLILENIQTNILEWREQVRFPGKTGQQILMVSGTVLMNPVSENKSYVILFDEVTELIKGQRDAAWSEMARRMAHEIKNPLTPIQLAAERLQHKYAPALSTEDSEKLSKLTNTIIHQVETLRDMVNNFSDYAQIPNIHKQPVDINPLVREVIDLYELSNKRNHFQVSLQADLPILQLDSKRIRQVLNNLIGNAVESCEQKDSANIQITTQTCVHKGLQYVELLIQDEGDGIDSIIISDIFEPYVTSKAKGTGLGLAIVKKIIEEHGGMVWLENNTHKNGVTAYVRLPLENNETVATS